MKRENRHSYGAFDAKNRLAELLARVASGEDIVITRHGRPVARLVPFKDRPDSDRLRSTVEGLRKLRKGLKLGKHSIRELIDEGRA